jgi:L-threonylcarbamoyladenylate synthase
VIVPFGERAVERAREILEAGGLVAFPTETVYGLGARADSAEAVRRIYAAKGRPAENPSIVHLHDASTALALADHPSASAQLLADRFWPGPLTMVVPVRKGAIASEAVAGGTTVALRVPRHPAALAILKSVNLPIAAPSANRSTAISPTTAAHVKKSLGDRVDLIVDAGPTGFGIESTIVDMTSDPPRVLRRGSISIADLREVLKQVVDASTVVTPERERAPSPGTQARHYAPRTELIIATRSDIERAIRESQPKPVGVLGFGPFEGVAAMEELPHDPTIYARGLYSALHRLDDADCDLLFAEEPPDEPEWGAVRDRLLRASTKLLPTA